MHVLNKAILTVAVITGCVFIGSSVLAQDTGVSGYDLQFFQPSIDGKGIMQIKGSNVLEHLAFHVGSYMNYAQGLLTATTPVGTTLTIVDNFMTGDFAFGVGLWDFMDVGIDVPVFFYEGGTNVNTARSFTTFSLGDVRLDVKFRVLKGEYWWPGIAFLSSVYLPTGNTAKFTGSKGVDYQGMLIVDKDFEHVYVAFNLGYRLGRRQVVMNIDHDDEFTFGAGVSIPLPLQDRSFEFIAEVYGSTVVRDMREITTPVEIVGGMRKRFSNNITVTLAGGGGLTDSAGSPDCRLVAGVTYGFGHGGTALPSSYSSY